MALGFMVVASNGTRPTVYGIVPTKQEAIKLLKEGYVPCGDDEIDNMVRDATTFEQLQEVMINEPRIIEIPNEGLKDIYIEIIETDLF